MANKSRTSFVEFHRLSQNSGLSSSLFIGVGNALKGDDAAGYEFVERCRKKGLGLKMLAVGISPENFTKQIINSSPDSILFIDAAEMGSPPGAVEIFTDKDISETDFSTHNISLKTFIHYIRQNWPQNRKQPLVYVVGIQPKNTRFGEPISKEVSSAIDTLVEEFSKLSKNA